MLDYDIVIIGGSLAGRYAAFTATQLQARVALVEPLPPRLAGQSYRLGYTQALRSVGQAVRHLHQVQPFGIHWEIADQPTPPNVSVHWRETMQWGECVVSNLEAQYSPSVLASMGVDVIFGQGQFVSQPRLAFEVNGRQLRSRTYLLAMGSQPRIPEIEGLVLTGFLTGETINKLTQIPERLAIIGGDPTGIELAQTFARLGSEVTIVVQGSQILKQEDSEAAAFVQAQLEAEGVRVLTQTPVIQTKQIQESKWIQAGNNAIEVDEIILAAGQQPQLKGLNLDAVGVQLNGRYLRLNQHLQTSNSRIYACGDLAGGYPFEHIANYEATIAIKNALYLPFFQVNYHGIPWAIFSHPELARVGLTEEQAQRRYGDQIVVYREVFKHLPKAIMTGETSGFYKLIAHRNGRILGGAIVGEQASEIIYIIALAIRQGLRINAIAELPQIWLTLSQIHHQTAIAGLQQRLRRNTLLYDWVENLFHWRRSWS